MIVLEYSVVVVGFFFFKQKTAYDMRISDWSSDVCSSDLFNALFMEDLKIIKKAVRRQVFAKNTNKALQEPILAVCLVIGIYFALKVFAMPVGEVIVMGLLLTKTVSVVGKAQQELQNMYATESGFTAVYEVIDDAHRERRSEEHTSEHQ